MKTSRGLFRGSLALLRAHPSLRHWVSGKVFPLLPLPVRFRLIYTLNLWGSDASRSGRASSLEWTQNLRGQLPMILAALRVGTLVDVPCGDFEWMKEVDLGGIEYIGVDVVPDIIERNRARYGNGTARRFLVGDVTRGPIPPGDAILCRDLLPHLSLRDALLALAVIRSEGAHWLLSTTFTSTELNDDIVSGDFRPINLQRSPFDLPPPLYLIDDSFGVASGRCLGVWHLRTL